MEPVAWPSSLLPHNPVVACPGGLGLLGPPPTNGAEAGPSLYSEPDTSPPAWPRLTS